jgi:hypothetical protein
MMVVAVGFVTNEMHCQLLVKNGETACTLFGEIENTQCQCLAKQRRRLGALQGRKSNASQHLATDLRLQPRFSGRPRPQDPGILVSLLSALGPQTQTRASGTTLVALSSS